MPEFGRGRPFQPKQKTSAPTMPGAWLVTLRSVPHHYWDIKNVIESTGEARVYFGEALAYLKGQGVSLFRVEATGLGWVDALYRWWREAQRRDAIPFEIKVYVHNTEEIASFRQHPPEEIKARIEQRAPRFQLLAS
ncbi:hypothetical protein NET02_14275 [Thermomicrobiaceae bacterium CFH 74404]|uniref:Uncharacterized protein n=1 Tax=Thermalbibacter longus TaxID=2951981 RepID=A0AA42BAW9_9BACT|nr:hypothetical protein [Thermalbibacter longus]MCM8750316.1 hypothetical protein [Thermalbibacter longus]